MAKLSDKKISLLTTLAQRIRNARTHARLSQSALGKTIGVSDRSVSSYEQGRSQPSVETLQKIAKATSTPVSFFTEGNNLEAVIVKKLTVIEKELNAIKKLFLQQQKSDYPKETLDK